MAKKTKGKTDRGTLGDIAKGLGQLLGNAEKQWRAWQGPRDAVLEAVSDVRDRAAALLSEMGAAAGNESKKDKKKDKKSKDKKSKDKKSKDKKSKKDDKAKDKKSKKDKKPKNDKKAAKAAQKRATNETKAGRKGGPKKTKATGGRAASPPPPALREAPAVDLSTTDAGDTTVS